MADLQGEGRVQIDAAPEKVYDLVADITRMGELSPENTGGEWLDGATGPVEGAKFRGKNRKGIMRWSTKCTVIKAEPGKEFAFRVGGDDGTVWRYRFEAIEGGTAVTESFEKAKYGAFYRILTPVIKRQREMQEGVEKTLQQLKSAAEGSVPE